MFAWLWLALIRALSTRIEMSSSVFVTGLAATRKGPFLVDTVSIFWMTVIMCFDGTFIHILNTCRVRSGLKLELSYTGCVLIENTLNFNAKLKFNLVVI